MAAAAFTMMVESISQIITFAEYDTRDPLPPNSTCIDDDEGKGVTFSLEAIIICVITVGKQELSIYMDMVQY